MDNFKRQILHDGHKEALSHFFLNDQYSFIFLKEGKGHNNKHKKQETAPSEKPHKHKHKDDSPSDKPHFSPENPPQKLIAATIPKFVEELPIPFVLYDAKENHKVQVSLRQISQQVLPEGFPKTVLWAYGNPDHPSTFFHPSGTIENTEYKTMMVTWINELVVDPDKCRRNPDSDACNYLEHIIQDKHGVPLVDQTLHWAAPNQECASGEIRTDCRGSSQMHTEGPFQW